MTNLRSLKQKLSQVSAMWEAKRYDEALSRVTTLREAWPGNTRLLVLWASLVQLQENPVHELSEVKEALQQAVAMDDSSPAAAIELGHFLDSVEDDPRSAVKVFSEAVVAARSLLAEALLGQARALLQLNKKAEAIRALGEALQMADRDLHINGAKSRSQFDGLANEIETLLKDFGASAEVQSG